MPIRVTVITCTYNPRPDQMARTVVALREQTLARAEWEYLVIDNNSTRPPTPELDWHPCAQLLHETKAGKIHALLHAIQRARGELLVIVDDDNVLAPDYLENALEIAHTRSFLGVWGGNIVPDFEIPVPAWAQPYLGNLTICECAREEWSNQYTAPAVAGAGMCVRAVVARQFLENIAAHPERLQLGRTGSSVLTGEDWEMSLAACDLGLGMGHLPKLRLTHLIGAARLELDYLLHLHETMCFSRQLFVHIRGLKTLLTYPPTRLGRFVRWFTIWRVDPVRRQFLKAEWRALAEANAVIAGKSLGCYADTEASAAQRTGVRAAEAI